MQPFLKIIKNKYFITLLVVFVWLMFFDSNGFIPQIKLRAELKDLRTQKRYLIEKINSNKAEINKLKSDSSYLETQAREKYLMKKDNEDIFIFEEIKEKE